MADRYQSVVREGVLWSCLLIGGGLYLAGAFEKPELITIDARHQWFASVPQTTPLVLVLIDPESLKRLRQWPWPRGYYARMIDRLHEAGARLIALDIDFSLPSVPDEDRRLAEAIESAGNVVLGAFHEDRLMHDRFQVSFTSLPMEGFSRAALGVGSLLIPVDSDGVVRRGLLADRVQGQPMHSFGVEVARHFAGVPHDQVGFRAPDRFGLGDRLIRTGPDGTFYIRFRSGHSAYPVLSFADVLESGVDPEVVQDKIVLVGASAVELRDIWKTPAGVIPGVQIQAGAVESVLYGAAFWRLAPWVSLLAMAGFTVLLRIPVVRIATLQGSRAPGRVVVFAFVTALLSSLVCILGVILFRYYSIIWDVVPILSTLLFQFAALSLVMNLIASRTVRIQTLSLSALHTAGSLSLTDKPFGKVLFPLYDMLREIMPVHAMSVEIERSGGKPVREGMPREACIVEAGNNQPLLSRTLARSRETGESVLISNPDIWLKRRDDRITGRIRTSLIVPLWTHARPLGAIHLHSLRRDAFDTDRVKVVQTLARQLAMNIENLELLEEVRRLFHQSIEAFSTALEFRDNETQGHSHRVSRYALETGRLMGLDSEERQRLQQGAMLHDIGKIGVPDAILRKPAGLTPDEMQVMKRHPEYGYWMLKNVDFPDSIARILLQHHERYDGSGYPAGLRGEEIDLCARIFAVADAYDAILSDRPYRRGASHEAACEEIVRCSGSQFDPAVVDAFLKIDLQKLRAIQLEVEQTVCRKRLGQAMDQAPLGWPGRGM